MDKSFIHKVNQIVLKHIEDELFGVSELASEIGFSQSQLLRKIKAITGKTATEFIREIRLEEAAKLIQEDKYTASEISYQVGFSSPSYFNKCFHDHFGVTPGDYTVENRIDDKKNNSIPEKQNRLRSKKNRITGSIILIVLAISSFIFINRFIHKKQENKYYSIAVLPIKYLSNDKTNQYFADGVMDGIINHLSSIKELRVISRTSMEHYRETDKTAPEIAKKLKVSHIIESSIQKYNDSVMIIIQLIDAKKDKNIWSKKFEKEFKNIFSLESEIAQQIAEELKVMLSPSKIKQIETKPTDNIEAYTLYLKGRFFWHQRTEKALNKSVYYFNCSLDLDPNYALAYAGLADAYFIKTWWGFYPENAGYDKAKEFAKKALSINNKLSEAHATLGGIYTWHERDWLKSEEELKLSVSLNSNNATAHQYYSELLNILGRNKESREQIDLALNLNPYSLIMNSESASIYYNNYKYEKAIEAYKKTLSLDEMNIIFLGANLGIIKCYIKLQREEEVIKNVKKFVLNKISPEDHQIIDKIYQENGIEGVEYWFADWMVKNKLPNLSIAKFYGCIGDSQKTLKYLERCFQENEIALLRIKNASDFNFIKMEPRFIAILKKLNLAD